MPPTPSYEIEKVFFEALEKSTVQGRAEFIEKTCSARPDVSTRVEALLLAHERAGNFLSTPVIELDSNEFLLWDDSEPPPPTRVGQNSVPSDDLSFLEPSSDSATLGRFAGYGVTQLLGRGGAGIVLKALDQHLNRIVAIKVLAPEWAGQPRARQRFLREARAAAAVKHENVVAVYAVDELAEIPHIVMEFVDGETLHDRLVRDPQLSVSVILQFGHQIASGLASAHKQRLVHRDIKPANILVEETTDKIKITDFGLARAVDDVQLTQDGVIAGTPQYMSPEQAKGEEFDHRSDLFSLGSVLYTLCVGHPPFRANSPVAMLRAIVDEDPEPLESVRFDLPQGLNFLIHQLLEKAPNRRPPTATDVLQRLEEVSQEWEASPKVQVEFPLHRKFRDVRVWASLAAAFATASIAGVYSFTRKEPKDSSTVNSTQDEDPLNETKTSKSSEQKGPRPRNDVKPRPKNVNPFDSPVVPSREIGRMSVPNERLFGLAVSPDGQRVYASATNDMIYCWDTETGNEILKFPGQTVSNEIAISPDGSRLLACTANRSVYIWDTETGKVITRLAFPIPARHLVFSPDGQEFAVTFFPIRPMPKPNQKSTDGQSPVTGAPIPSKINIFETKTWGRTRSFPSKDGHSFYQLAWSKDGKSLVVGTDAGRVLVLDAATGKFERQLTVSGVPGPAYGVHFSPDGKRLYAAGSGNLVWCWSWPEGREIFSRRFQHGVVRFALSPDGRWMAIGGALEVRLLDLHNATSPKALHKLEGHTSPIREVAFVPDRNVVVSCAWDGTVRLWRTPH